MWTTVCISAATIAAMIFGILRCPEIKISKKISFSSYWVTVSIGALALIASGQISIGEVFGALSADTAINPLKILVLFISMTILSIYLDEMGFFRYLADKTLKSAGYSQKKMFLYLYLIVSVLTVFTSNDIIILSFTPFICYFAKNARINPIPYLAAEFVAANTWSMALIIGNPTNIYIGTAYGINFVEYTAIMGLPTLLAGGVSLAALYFMFHKKLSAPISGRPENYVISDHTGLVIGIVFLLVCTVMLAVASYIGLEMWKISAISVIALLLTVEICSVARKKDMHLAACLKRAPWQLAPFLLSMFVITMALGSKGITVEMANALGTDNTVLKYGIASFLGANAINNIPMSVLFCSIISDVPPEMMKQAVFATVAGSNIGAFLTQVGALAGIMWTSILNHHGLKFTYSDFLKIGIFIAVPALLAALIGITITL